MDQTEVQGQSTNQPGDMENSPVIVPPHTSRMRTVFAAQAGAGTCATCGAAVGSNGNGGEMATFIYALGSIDPRSPSAAVEREIAQAMGRGETAGLTDRQALHALLGQRQNRYLARQLCYVLTIERVDSYILQPHDPADLDLLVEAIRPTPTPLDVDVVIGVRGPIAPPEMCNGLMIPIVFFDQIYSFPRDALFAAITAPEGAAPEQIELLRASAQDLFDRIMRIADNLGATDEHRALNYLAVRYDQIYRHTAQMFLNNFSLTAVDIAPSRLSGTRKLVNVIGTYTNRATGVTERYRVRVDVTEEFPFLDARLEPYYDIER
jgi:PatG C-terminal